MKIYAGSSNQELAHTLAQNTGFERGEIELSRFNNDESRVLINDANPGNTAVLQSFSNPVDRHIVEFCLIVDALKRLGSTDITAIIPYLGYSKQDRVFRLGEPLSVKVVANIIQTSSVKKIITFDLHNAAIMGFFDIPLINCKALPLFVEYFSKGITQKNYCVVSPDAGAVKSSTEFANALNLPIAYINKSRDLDTGLVSVVDIDRDVTGKHILILDDMIASGETMLSVGKFLKNKGAENVTIAATHHLYLNGVQEKLDNSIIDHVVVTNSIQKPDQISSSKLTIIHLENLLASIIS